MSGLTLEYNLQTEHSYFEDADTYMSLFNLECGDTLRSIIRIYIRRCLTGTGVMI